MPLAVNLSFLRGDAWLLSCISNKKPPAEADGSPCFLSLSYVVLKSEVIWLDKVEARDDARILAAAGVVIFILEVDFNVTQNAVKFLQSFIAILFAVNEDFIFLAEVVDS